VKYLPLIDITVPVGPEDGFKRSSGRGLIVPTIGGVLVAVAGPTGVGVSTGVGEGVTVLVDVGVSVGRLVGVSVAVAVAVAEGCCVGVGSRVLVAVAVARGSVVGVSGKGVNVGCRTSDVRVATTEGAGRAGNPCVSAQPPRQ
jgi:hypothetical protein